MNSNAPTPPAAPPIRLRPILLIVSALFLVGLAAGLLPRLAARHKLLAETRAESVPTVMTAQPKPAEINLGTPLPADVMPFIQASIHARASGYLKSWQVDIGDHVTNNQVLAEIDTPELEEQLLQARAELDQASAARDLAKVTADRWTDLAKTASVSDQETAEKKSDYVLKQAMVDSARANVQRLSALKNFDLVTASFAGVITARNTDIGQLIAADSGPELFRLAQTDPLRIYVRVPQTLAHAVQPGQKAELMLQDQPSRGFEATVTRIAGAMDQSTRTLQVELQVPNPRGEIFAGSYAQVRFKDGATAQVLVISDNALLFRAQGMQAAVVAPDNKVQLHSIKLGRDFGNEVEVVSGLTAADHVILNPPDAITEGMVVHVAPMPGTNSAPLK